jgi:hypothetical protein
MPTVEQILLGLKEVANNWRPLAIFWHAYLGAMVVMLLLGKRPPRRLAGIWLGLPLLSVSIGAWTVSNPFNGIVFAFIGILFILISTRLPRENVQLAPLPIMIPGLILFLFGWVYPHFLETSSILPYLYSAPTGLIPCPTLSIVIGLFLILNRLGSRALSLVLGLSGVFYGLIGVARLRVSIDGVLLLGAVITLTAAFRMKHQKPLAVSRA